MLGSGLGDVCAVHAGVVPLHQRGSGGYVGVALPASWRPLRGRLWLARLTTCGGWCVAVLVGGVYHYWSPRRSVVVRGVTNSALRADVYWFVRRVLWQ